MPAFAKTACPITCAKFRKEAKPITVQLGDQTLTLPMKEFSTGSFGYYLNQKIALQIDGEAVTGALQIQIPIVGSKDAPRE